MIKQRPLYHVLQKPFRGIIEPNRILNGEHMASAESPRGRRVARGVAMGAIAPPLIPKVALTIFRLIKLLMCKLRNGVSANQRNCLKKKEKKQLSVEPGQSRMVSQLPMINQTLCTVQMLENSCHG